MPINTTLPTSRRGYLSQVELAQYADITINDADEANDVISQAEEMIDSNVGYQDKFMEYDITGLASSGTSNTITLETLHQNSYDEDYFAWCQIEIIGGTGQGQIRKITTSTKPGVLTVDSNWSTTPDSTSFYKINQLGKFPRKCDVTSHSHPSYTKYYKSIPEMVRRATAAQVAYVTEMGASYFKGDKSNMESESIGDYSYSRKGSGTHNLIAPKAQLLLRGIKNRLGTIIV